MVKNIQWQGESNTGNAVFESRSADQDFINTNGATLLDGRDIDVANFPTDTSACLLNEAALNIMNLKGPVGKIIHQGTSSLQIIGVIKNFINGSPLQESSPLIIRGSSKNHYLNIRLSKAYPSSAAEKIITPIFKKFNPGFITEFQYADEEYALKMEGIRLTGKLANIFTSIAIFISCLGLFGLVIYIIGNKAKEVSIRKILGAGLSTITFLLTKDFIRLVLISILIASPISWLLMSSFLQPIYYRIPLSFVILLEGAFVVLAIAIATISVQSIQAAMGNPVKNLRDT